MRQIVLGANTQNEYQRLSVVEVEDRARDHENSTAVVLPPQTTTPTRSPAAGT